LKKNVGGMDRKLRFGAGVLIILLGLVYGSWWGIVGLLPIMSTVMGWTPLYLPFRFSTRRDKKLEQED